MVRFVTSIFLYKFLIKIRYLNILIQIPDGKIHYLDILTLYPDMIRYLDIPIQVTDGTIRELDILMQFIRFFTSIFW